MAYKRNWFSNFVQMDEPLVEDGIAYWTVEQYYQAMKTLNTNHRSTIATSSAGDAKKLGRKVELRPDWEEIKLSVMEKALRYKFQRGTSQYKKLMSTGSEKIVEWNYWHDNYWGVCTCQRCSARRGENHLGKILMKIREENQDKSSERRYTPNKVEILEPNEVFVFGSNESGFHGAGAAGVAFRGESNNTWRHDEFFLRAMKAPVGSPERIGRWAVFGVARGHQIGQKGQSYAIQTIKRPGLKRSTSRREIYFQLLELSRFAEKHPELTFLVTKMGYGLAGHSKAEMTEVFKYWCEGHHEQVHENIILPVELDFRRGAIYGPEDNSQE
jgi:ribA/ribD-fused uncharacterized protein